MGRFCKSVRANHYEKINRSGSNVQKFNKILRKLGSSIEEKHKGSAGVEKTK